MIFLFFLIFTLCGATELPKNYDTRTLWGFCNNSFRSEDQGDCNSCASVALANSLSIRSCIRDGRNVRFSAQRIWDCYGGSCENGVIMKNFLFTIMYGVNKKLIMDFYPKKTVMQNSNISACVKNSKMKEEWVDTVSSHEEWWASLENVNTNDRNPTERSKSVQSIQSEIMINGPVIAILRLTQNEMVAFSNWKTDSETKVFYLDFSIVTEPNDRLHAVTLIGWDIDNQTEKFYWKILNSFGQTWGTNGIGNIPFGLGSLEHEWYAVHSSPVTCHTDETGCTDENTSVVNTNWKKNTSNYQEDMPFLPHFNLNIKGNPIDDSGILGITVLCMILLSAMICSIHQTDKSKKYNYNTSHSTIAF